MALITVSGFPSAGKTRFAERLMASFEERLRDPTYHGPALELVRIEDDLGHLGREAYSGACSLIVTRYLFGLTRRCRSSVHGREPAREARSGKLPDDAQSQACQEGRRHR